MKVKLLKKIRERYSITHYPNGTYLWGDFYKGPITLLADKNSSYRYGLEFGEKAKAYDKLYFELLKWIQKDYGNFKSSKCKITSEQLWYKK